MSTARLHPHRRHLEAALCVALEQDLEGVPGRPASAPNQRRRTSGSVLLFFADFPHYVQRDLDEVALVHLAVDAKRRPALW